MKPTYSDLSPEQKATFGNGCGLYARFLNVPDFIFTASCNQHDFNYRRGVGANHWYENLWKFPYYYIKANWDFYTHMLADASKWWHYVVATIYFIVVTFVSFPFFDGGRFKSIEEIMHLDKKEKLKDMIK